MGIMLTDPYKAKPQHYTSSCDHPECRVVEEIKDVTVYDFPPFGMGKELGLDQPHYLRSFCRDHFTRAMAECGVSTVVFEDGTIEIVRDGIIRPYAIPTLPSKKEVKGFVVAALLLIGVLCFYGLRSDARLREMESKNPANVSRSSAPR